MWTTVSSVFRFLILMAVALVTVALWLGRPQPEGFARRTAVASVPVAINRSLFTPARSSTLYYEPESGRIHDLKMPTSELLDHVSFSPWRDRNGEFQVVGLWSRFVMKEAGSVLDDTALIRLTAPEGQILDRVPVEMNPVSPPCWYPGTEARVLYAAGDGRLHQVHFEARGSVRESITRGLPQPLTWNAEPELAREIVLNDPCWPRDPRFVNCILVSLQRTTMSRDRLAPPAELWWLRLDVDGLEIVDAGRLLTPVNPDPDSNTDEIRGEFAPSVMTTPDGRVRLAYLTSGAKGDWRIHLTTLTFDERTGIPQAERGAGRYVSAGYRPDAPSLSPDGRWLMTVVHSPANETTLRRIPIPEFDQADQVAEGHGPNTSLAP